MASASAVAQSSTFFAQISGHQQVPSVASEAEGRVQIRVNLDSVFIIAPDTFRLTSPLNTDIGVHIHTGLTGSNGPVVLPLPYTVLTTNTAKIKDTVFVLRRSFVDSLRASMGTSNNYINVHTRNYPAGEVRGQLIPITIANTARFDAMLYGDQENPGVLTDGMGGVTIEVTADSMYVSGSFVLDNKLLPVGGTGAHIHIGYFGQNGGILLSLQPTLAADSLSGTFSRKINAFARDTAVINPMNLRRAYVNIHSVAHPSGEIRGQVVPLATNLYFSHVSYNEPTPFPNADAYLRVMAEKVFRQNRVLYSGSWFGWGQEVKDRKMRVVTTLGNPFAGAGSAVGLPVRTIAADSSSGVVRLAGLPANTYTADQLAGLFLRYSTSAQWRTGTGATTAVPYSARHYHECKRAFYSYLTPSQEVPANPSGAFGDITTEYYGSRVDVTGFVGGLTSAIEPSIQGGFHIHTGLAGRNGGIVAPVTYVSASNAGTAIALIPDRSQVNLTPELAARMKERGFYYNLHTENYPMGEVRGQIMPQSNTVYQAIVEPQQAVPGGTITEGDGVVLIEAYGSKMTATGTFNQLTGFDPNVAGGSHLHAGLPGMTGGIKYPLATSAAAGAADGEFLPSANTFVTTSATSDSLTNRAFYVNIHTQKAPTGEIRGQVGPLATNVVHVRLSPEVTKPYTGGLGTSLGRGNLHGEVFDTTVVMYGNVSGLSSAIDVSIAGGAHIHTGKVAETGSILFPLNLQLAAKDTAAMVMPRTNVTEILALQRGGLLFGGLYANVHTTNAPSGAIRGQVLLAENQFPDIVESFTFPADDATVDLNAGTIVTNAVIDWEGVMDPDVEQRVAYIWQLYTDTTAAPIIQTTVDSASQVSFTFGALDTLLTSLGIDSGDVATVFHRAWTTDGSLLTPGRINTVSFKRFGTSSVGELPAGSVRLVNNVSVAGGNMYLEFEALPAGRYRYDMMGNSGQVIGSAAIDHSGSAQRYELNIPGASAGLYFLRLGNERGEASTWGFLVR